MPDYSAWAEAFRQEHRGQMPWEDVARPGLTPEQSLAEHLVALEWSKRLGRAPTQAEWEAQHKQRWNRPGYELPSVKELTGQTYDEFTAKVRGLVGGGAGKKNLQTLFPLEGISTRDVPDEFARKFREFAYASSSHGPGSMPTATPAGASPLAGDEDAAVAAFIAKNKANLVKTNPNWDALLLEFAKLSDPEAYPATLTGLTPFQKARAIQRLQQIMSGLTP